MKLKKILRKSTRRVFWVFAVSFLIVGLFSFSPPIFSGVKAQEPQPIRLISYTELEANPPLPPQRILLGDGARIWKTRLGNYTFDKSKPFVFRYHDRFGEQLIVSATWWINSTDIFDFAKVVGFTVLSENDTVFKYQYSVTYKGGGLTKDTVVGNITVTWVFDSINAPKQSVEFSKDLSAWTTGGLGDFNIFLDILPIKKYLKTTDTSAVDLASYISTVKLLDNVKKCAVGNASDVTVWNKGLGTFWEDFGVGCPVWGGAEKVFGGKGFLIVFPSNVDSVDPSLYEYWNTGDDTSHPVWSTYWKAQTFTVGDTAHMVTSVKIKMFAYGSPPSPRTIGIRATDASGHPTGSDLTSGTYLWESGTSPGVWQEVTVTPYLLNANTKYAIVHRVPNGESNKLMYWRADTDGAYAGGNYEESANSGSSWTTVLDYGDFMFEVWGTPPNTAPTIDTFQAPSTAYANKYFFLNATIDDADGVADFDYATIEINGSVILKWVNSTNTFSEQSDANGYCTLDASNSQRTTVNSTAYKLSWKIKLTWTYP